MAETRTAEDCRRRDTSANQAASARAGARQRLGRSQPPAGRLAELPHAPAQDARAARRHTLCEEAYATIEQPITPRMMCAGERAGRRAGARRLLLWRQRRPAGGARLGRRLLAGRRRAAGACGLRQRLRSGGLSGRVSARRRPRGGPLPRGAPGGLGRTPTALALPDWRTWSSEIRPCRRSRTASSTWSSSAGGSPAPALPLTPPRAATAWRCWSAPTTPRAPPAAPASWCTGGCATCRTSTSAWCARRCWSASCWWRSPRTWCARCRWWCPPSRVSVPIA